MGTSDGFFPIVCRWWPSIVEALQDSGKPWPVEAARADLRWWEDFVRMKPSEVSFPGRRSLARRWSWKDSAVRRLLKDRDGWADPRFVEEKRPVAARSSPGPRPVANGSPCETEEDPPGPRPVAARSSPGLTLFNSQVHRGTLNARARGRAREATQDEEPAMRKPAQTFDDPSPRWVKLWTKSHGKKLAVEPLEVYGGLNRVLEELRGRLRKPSESASRPVLRLWREALEVEEAATLDELVDLVVLLARAARDCPDPIFRNDIRGEREDGTAWKKDTSRTVSSVCRLAPKQNSEGATWEKRLEIARKWEDQGFPLTPANQQTRTARRGAPRSAADRLFDELEA